MVRKILRNIQVGKTNGCAAYEVAEKLLDIPWTADVDNLEKSPELGPVWTASCASCISNNRSLVVKGILYSSHVFSFIHRFMLLMHHLMRQVCGIRDSFIRTSFEGDQ